MYIVYIYISHLFYLTVCSFNKKETVTKYKILFFSAVKFELDFFQILTAGTSKSTLQKKKKNTLS